MIDNREWWISNPRKPRSAPWWRTIIAQKRTDLPVPHMKNGIHVIEYSAVERLQEDYAKLRAALEKIDNRSWVHSNPDCVVAHVREVLEQNK